MASISAAVASISKTELKNVKNADNLHHLVQQKQLGADALADTNEGCKNLFAKARRAVCLFGTDEQGAYNVRWKKLSLRKKLQMSETLVCSSPWLKNFEEEWADEWLLQKFVDQRVVNRQVRRQVRNKKIRRAVAVGTADIGEFPST